MPLSSCPDDNVKLLHISLDGLKAKLCSELSVYHAKFATVSEVINELALEYEELSQTISEAHKRAHDIMPALANASKDLLSNGPDESGLSANLSQLEFLTKARATGAYLLQVHTCLQSLIKNISSFRNRIGGCNILADVVEFGDFDNAFLSRSPTLHPLDKESEILIDSIANDLMTVSDAFTHNLPDVISKEEFICLRSMLSCFSSHKAQMINYVDRLWRQAVTFRTFKASDSCDLGDRPFWAFTKPTRDFADSISNNSSGDESDAKTSELNGEACESSGDDILFNKTNNSINQTRFLSRLTVTTNYSHLKNLLTLMTALNIEKLFITRLSDNIWKHMFLPWLELTEHSRIRWRFFQSSTFPSQNIWQLDLLEAFTSNGIPFASHPHASHSKLTTSLVRLRSVLTDLHTHLFGLPLPAESITKKASKLSHLEDISIFDSEGRPRRVIDIAVASPSRRDFSETDSHGSGLGSGEPMDGRFDDQLAFHLIRGRLASALSDDLSDKIGHTSCTNGSELGVAPPARNPGAAVFSLLSSVMLPLANLLEQAEQMGYLTPTCGGSRLRTWLASQTTLEQTHRVNAYLAQLRTCLTDRQRLLTHFEVHGDVSWVEEDGAIKDDSNKENDKCDLAKANSHSLQPCLLKSDLLGHGNLPVELTNMIDSFETEQLRFVMDLKRMHFPYSQVPIVMKDIENIVSSIISEIKSILSVDLPQALRRLNPHRLSDTSKTVPAPPDFVPFEGEDTSATVQICDMASLTGGLIQLVPIIMQLFTHLVPSLHSQELSDSIRLSALYYNACMFLSYQCLTLGKLRLLPLLESLVAFFPNTPNLASPDQTEPRLSGSNLDVAPLSHTSNTRISPWLQLVPQMEVVAVSTCVLVPKLRHSGIRVLEDQIARQKLAISSALLKADGFKNCSFLSARPQCTQAIHSVCQILSQNCRDLEVIPASQLFLFIKTLCNEVCSRIVSSIISLVDITTPDAIFLVSNLKQVIDSVENVFSNCRFALIRSQNFNSLTSFKPNGKSALTSMTSLQFAFSEVKSASRLQGIISFLSSDSMSYVETELWALGMGPLAKKNYLMPDEIRSLVRAVYSDSPARTQFLQKLSSPSLLFRI